MSDRLQEIYGRYDLSTPSSAETPIESIETPVGSYRHTADRAPTFEEAERIATTKYNLSSNNAIIGTLTSAGVEIGGGIAGTIAATKMARRLKWIKRANYVKTAAVAGVVAPEPTTTIGGAVAFGLTEAAVWGFSNFAGQSTRKAFGIQDHYSGGEMVAAAVFGVGAAAAQGTKLIELGASLQSFKAWKNTPVASHLGKAFITGAGLGAAESLLRQELQLVLNERENRDVMDYMFSTAAGGSFNTLFSVFGRTGAWGLMKAADSAGNARIMAQEKLKLAQQIKNSRKRKKEIKKWTEAINHLDEIETSFRGAEQAERDFRDQAPDPKKSEDGSGDPRQAPELDDLPNPDAPKPDGIATVAQRAKDIGITEKEFRSKYPELAAQIDKRNPTPTPEGIPDAPELKIEPDINPDYTRNGGYRKILGYNVKGLDGKDYYIEAANLEQPKALRFAVYEGKEGLKILKQFPTKKEAIEFLKTKKLEGEGTPKPDEGGIPKPDEEGGMPKPDEEEGIPKPDEEEGAPKPDEEDGGAPKPDRTERQKLIDTISAQFKNIKPENLGRDLPNVQRDSARLKDEMEGEMTFKTEEVTAKYNRGEELTDDELDDLLELIADLRQHNQTDAIMKTAEGRAMQANRTDSDRYLWDSDISTRAVKEDSALYDMEETLLKMKEGRKGENLEKQLEEFLSNQDITNAANYAVFVRNEATKEEFEAMTPEQREVAIQNSSVRLVQQGIKTLTKQLEQERAKMMQGMKTAMNKHQRDKLKEEAEKRLKENPTIQMLQQQIDYYKGAERELALLAKQRKELARLASLYGEGNMTKLRKEIEVKDRLDSAPSEYKKIQKQISELRNEMRKKIKEIDKAKEEIDNPVSFAEKRIPKLEKELQELRDIRSGTKNPKEGGKPDRAKTEKELDLEARIKFYKDEVSEIKRLEKAEKELARLVNIEADGSITQIRNEIDGKPKTLSENAGKVDEVLKKISQAKARMRDKVKAIDKARLENEKFDLFFSMQNHAMRNIEANAGNRTVEFIRSMRAARKLALIDPLPSVMAGVPTGVGLAFRSAIRPFVMAPLDFARYGGDTTAQLFTAELKGLATAIVNWSGTLTSMGRTFQRGSSATDRVMSKYMEDTAYKQVRMGNSVSIDRAMRTAKARVQQKNDPMNSVLDLGSNKGWAILSLGVRGISAVDDGFRRQLLRGRLETAARRKAILEHPKDAKAAEETYNGYMKTMWKDNDGLSVLNEYHDFIDDVNDINQNLLFAAQHDNPELFHQNMGEQLIAALSRHAKKDNALAFFIDAFMPYISVPVRGVYRGIRFATAPLGAAYSVSPASPYARKIKERQDALDVANQAMLGLKDDSPMLKARADEVKQLNSEIEVLKQRQTKYTEDYMVDTAFGVGLATLGMGAALYGEATGSLNWMTDDQKEKNKLKPFKIFGMDYSAAAPWSIPIAIGADMATYIQAREAGILKPNQNMLFMLSSTMVELSEQVPMMQGMKTFNAIIAGGEDTKAKLVGRLGASYVPIPAQIRKTLMAMNEDGTIGDLRGGTFGQRMAYSFFGTKPINRMTGYFGEDLKGDRTALQHAVIRQAPSKRGTELETEFERIIASDAFDNIQPPPSSLGNKIKMTSFIDADGVTLQYAFAQKLRSHRMVYKGKRRTIEQAANHLIKSSKWRAKHRIATISPSLAHTNEGLRELNRLLQDYYMDVRMSIINDSKFTRRFVNSKDENLLDIVNRKDTEIRGNLQPIRDLLRAN